MKESCVKLGEEFGFFQDLLLNILVRRALLKKFEDKVMRSGLPEGNDFVSFVWYGYVVSQLSDCRKFFDRDDRAHSFRFVVCHLDENSSLKKKHEDVLKSWKDKKLEQMTNKYLLHAESLSSGARIDIPVADLNLFIDELQELLEAVVRELSAKYSGISSHVFDSYLAERELEVDVFFEQIKVST